MLGSERKAAAKEVDAVFSTAAVAETGGGGGDGGDRRQRATGVGGGDGGDRRQRATGVGDNRVDGRLGSGDGGSVRTRRDSGGRRQLPGHGGSRERRRRRRMQPTMLGVDAGETDEKRLLGNRERRRRWLGLCGVEKETEEEAEVDSCDGELGSGTGGLMKTETRPMATEKSEGREDQHVVSDGKEEEGERDSGGDEVRRGSGDSITEEKGGGVCGDGREGREGDGRRWRKSEEREKRQGGSPVEERERREEKPGLTASRGRSRGRRQRSASKNGDAGARRDNGGMAHHLLIECHPYELNSELKKL